MTDRSPELVKTAFLIPGQGSQFKGMGRAVWELSQDARQIFEQASDHFGFSLPRLCFEDPKGELEDPHNHTLAIQAAVFTVSVATAYFLFKKGVISPERLGPHSAGKVAAAVISGSLELSKGLELVGVRGKTMQDDSRAAIARSQNRIVGLSQGIPNEEIEATITNLLEKEDINSVQVTVINPGDQTLIGGLREQVERFVQLYGDRRLRLFSASPLSHHPLLTEAQRQMNEFFKGFGVNFKDSDIPIQDDASAALLSSGADILGSFRGHLDNSINVAGSVREMIDAGIRRFVEIGPKTVLVDRVRKTYPGLVETLSTSDLEGIKQTAKVYDVAL